MRTWLNNPAHLAPLASFRILFGALIVYSTLRFWANGWIASQYVDPTLLFPFYGCEWLPRPSETGMYLLFGGMAIGGIGVMLGLFYRYATALFFLCFTYVELMDRANYLNHYYFVTIIAAVLLFLPAGKMAAVDLRFQPENGRSQAPWWMVNMPRILITLLYFFAGLAKLQPEWLGEALPMRIWLPVHADMPLLGPMLDEPWVAYAFSWAGACFDLFVGFALWFKRTRLLAYVAVLAFHALTWALFPIGVFPLMMMVLTLVFFPASSHQKAFALLRLPLPSKGTYAFRPILSRVVGGFFVVFLSFQITYPFRYLLYPGDLLWNEEGYRFSWRVMLMEKAGNASFFVKDARYPGEKEVTLGSYLTPNQEKQLATQPDMLVYFAHWIAEEYAKQGVQSPKVRAEVWVSLNGDGSQLFIDPYVDLSKAQDSFQHQDWIIPRDSVITQDELHVRRAEMKQSHGW